MPLTAIWKATPATILGMNISAILNIATNGDRLRDGSDGAREFREFLGEIDAKKLSEFAVYCVENAFPDSGQVLQDLVNEIGRRLGFKAENGRYQGVRNDIGFDGIWSDNEGSIVVEVKTTDAYTIKLDTVARYRDRLVENGRVGKDAPILLVIGRNDTSSLEAQVRGSRHAWSMRIVSVDALIKLMDVNLSTSSAAVTEKIHTILRPMEYTRIDEIVDVVFTTIEDKESSVREDLEAEIEDVDQAPPTAYPTPDRTPKEILAQRKQGAVDLVSKMQGVSLIRKRHSMYASPDDDLRVVVAVSKRYERDGGYWYAFHDNPQRSYLRDASTGFLVLSMVDQNFVHAIPITVLDQHWDDLGETVRPNGAVYKHLSVFNSDGKFVIRLRGANKFFSIDEYRLSPTDL
jgi:hypothetical protein